MKTLTFPGGWYADCLTSGRYVVLIEGSHLETDAGRVDFMFGPGPTTFEPLFPRLSDNGLALAGQAHWDSGATVEYSFMSKTWVRINQAAIGVSPVIYDKANVLHISDGSVGSQGWRYVAEDGTLVTGDATYAPGPGFSLYEWTDLSRGGDTLIIGQGPEDGCHVWDGTTHRILADGACRFIRAHRVGDDVSVAIWRIGAPTLLVWATVAELLVLPVVAPPPVSLPIGPMGPASPIGTVVDVASFFAVDPTVWPRGDPSKGDAHSMDMQAVMHKGAPCIWFDKFGSHPHGQGKAGELLQIVNGKIHLLADCSNSANPAINTVDVWSNTQWLMATMQVGRQYGLVDNGSTLTKYRPDGTFVSVQDWTEENWIESHWEHFWCGEGWGDCEVIRYVYNASGFRDGEGTGHPDLYIETYYVGRKKMTDGSYIVISWGDWTSDPSSVVFATTHAVFPSPPSVHSAFWHKGGQRYTPVVPVFIPLASSTEEPNMKLPADVWARIQRFAEAYPPPINHDGPSAEHEDRCRVWTRCVCEQICAEFGPEWGTKRASSTRPPSKESIARQSGGALDGWDLLIGASSGFPVLSSDPQHHDLVAEGNQVFIPVAAVDRLGRKSARPDLPRWVGSTAFELGPKLAAGDTRFLDYLKQGFTVAREVVSTDYRNPRSFEEGRAQLPATFTALRGIGVKAEVVLLCDTNGKTKAEMLDHVAQCNTIMKAHASDIALVELANEIGHPVQSPYLMDIDFLEQLDAAVDLQFALAWGGLSDGTFEGGNVITFHSDRGKTPEENGVIMAARQAASGKPVIDDEPYGIAEVGMTANRQRTDDPNYALRLAQAAKANGILSTLHGDAGLYTTLDAPWYGPVQEEAAKLFLSEWNDGVVIVPPPVIPPVTGHPILDAPLSPSLPVGYQFFIHNWRGIYGEADEWFYRHRKTNNIMPLEPSDTDLGHGVWRGLYEGDRWLTLRAAWENTWPGGAPK